MVLNVLFYVLVVFIIDSCGWVVLFVVWVCLWVFVFVEHLVLVVILTS